MNNNIEDLYCRLYINSNQDEDALRFKISDIFGGRVLSRKIRDEHLDIYFCKNTSFDENRFNASIEGCVYSRYTAEVSPLHEVVDGFDTVDEDIYISILCHIIKSLKDMGCDVIAACEYEDLILDRIS